MNLAVEALAERIGELEPFGLLDGATCAAFADRCLTHRYRREEQILVEGQATDSLFLVLRGRVKMSRATPVGRSVILSLFGPGEVFGAVAALSSGVADASMAALTDTVCLELPRAELFELLADHPLLLPELLPLVTAQMVECKNCIVEMTGYRVEMRFGLLFHKLASQMGRKQDGGAVFVPLRLSRQELADMTATTIETCIRLMSRWGKQGLVETRTDGFLVLDPDTLEACALGRAPDQGAAAGPSGG
jgi:CRP-like cAMP-binding protein